jgi:predicted amidohydrolase YtcJ
MNTPRFLRIGSRGAARAAMCRPGACACVVRTPAERSDDAGAALRPRTRHPRVWLALTLAAVCLVAFLGSGAPDESADWVFRNGNILTLEGQGKDAGRVDALAVKGSRIVYAGNEEGLAAWSGPATRVVDLDGSTLMPGLIDAHFHLRNFGLLLSRLNLIGTKSWDEVVARVVERGATTSSGDWIFGRGWDQNDWDVKEFPTSAAIDSLLPGRLVYLRRVDGHAAVASRAALERAGIRVGTPDPPGGRILRDAAGVPTGVLIDAATTAVSSIIPEPTVAEQESLVAMAMRECAAAGLTGVHDMGTGAATLEALQRMDASGRLPLRVYSFIDSADPSFLRLIESGPRVALGEERLSVRGVKIHLDGAMGSRGAAMLEPYSDDPQNTGLLQLSDEELRTITGLAWERGFQLATHAIGDRANRVILDRYEELLRSTDAGADWRPRVEHAQILAPEDVQRFASLGVIASMQPTHATSDMPWAEDRVGAERIRGGYLWRSLLDSGAHLAFGSDCPVESHQPLLGVYAAATRQDLHGEPEGGWRAQERVTALEALRAFTTGAAYASFEEARLGTLAVGKEADCVLLSNNPLSVPPEKISRIRVLGTWVGGRLVHSDSSVRIATAP